LKVTRFDPKAPLIIVPGHVFGPLGRGAVRFAVDTGSAETIVVPGRLDDLGYNPREGEAITVVRSAIGSEPGYLIRVVRLRALGHEFTDFRVHAHDLPEGFGIEGLLGLSFLRHFNYEIRSAEGRILLKRLDDLT
jgi:predicted aspartyl protease